MLGGNRFFTKKYMQGEIDARGQPLAKMATNDGHHDVIPTSCDVINPFCICERKQLSLIVLALILLKFSTAGRL